MLNELSNHMADAVAAVAPSVVQVQGRRRPASGLIYADGVVLTTAHALGRENGVKVRGHDGTALTPATTAPRVGHLALAIGRSWSNAVTASAGIVSVIGGPLPTGRHRAIDQVIRTTAPMHDGFAGGAFLDTSGGLLGVATSAAIRGLGVIIPASIAWKAAASVLEHGRLQRGYLGIAGQSVSLPDSQRAASPGGHAVLVFGITDGSPAARAGVLVGDILLALGGHPIEWPEDLMDVLYRVEIGRDVPLRVLRGGAAIDVPITIGERPTR